ncbi:MAG: ABC transporter ATP-binding protein, partial [Collinsella sp.]|nr:ABC transporter ATP-binding protein [Collinsella sp.]
MKAAKAHAAAGNRNLIEAHGLVKNFDGFSLRDVDLVVEPGQVVGFVGKNGAGKSTTIRALLGMISLDGGSARVLGHDSWALSSESASRVKGQIGVVFDTLSLPGHLRVREVGTMMAGAYGAAWDADGFVRRLEGFGLDGAKNLKDLSRGMGMKLSLACALSHGARLLILDEATAGLDPMARDEILDILSTFVAEEGDDGSLGNGILMSSHITSDLEKIADVVVCIDQGRIVFSAPKEAITVNKDHH